MRKVLAAPPPKAEHKKPNKKTARKKNSMTLSVWIHRLFGTRKDIIAIAVWEVTVFLLLLLVRLLNPFGQG
ncbi:MAG TPA: hypothetical protein VFZ40_01565 [Pyrinomonadaceae bacterium]